MKATRAASRNTATPQERPEIGTLQANTPNPIFLYEVDIDLREPVAFFGDTARVDGRFRHHRNIPVEFGPAAERDLNLGFRIYRSADGAQIFEDRALVSPSVVAPGTWASMTVRIPASAVKLSESYRIVIDFVKENEYWFGSLNGGQTCERKLSFADPSKCQASSPAMEGTLAARPHKAMDDPVDSTLEPVAPPSVNTRYNIVFDVSDLIQYFQNARLPTGIQRVQIEVITNLIFSLPKDTSLMIACFTRQSDSWLELPALFFNHVCKLAVVGGDRNAPEWLRVLEEIAMHLQQARKLVFPGGAYLINLGTSWWLQNYFLRVRAAKARYGIRYVPFVHDCIPIITPEHCVERLTRDFITWVMGAFQHADHFLVNSRSTSEDIRRVAGFLGHDIAPPSLVRLDADYRAANAALPAKPARVQESELFLKNDLKPGHFVLFVSTIESRKNHLMAFSAWLTLIKKFGTGRIPKLVCVGNRGWLNDAIYARLEASDLLRQKVVMLSNIADPDLEALYRNCLFTLYPSSYEGWGLPVTESLCFGKVPVLANASSLPEAAGEFGEYFDLGSETALSSLLERMIFDEAYREKSERRVAKGFRPRTWKSIASQIVTQVKEWAATDEPFVKTPASERGLWPFRIELGRYYALVENEEIQIWRGMASGEMFRQGEGWWWPEPWGCWTKACVARLAFVAPFKTDVGAVIYVGVRGVQGQSCKATVTVANVTTRQVTLAPQQDQWLVFRLGPAQLSRVRRSTDEVLVEMLFSADRAADFRAATSGADPRVASVGVLGFMACRDTDLTVRMDFTESVALGDLKALTGRPVDAADYFSASAAQLP